MDLLNEGVAACRKAGLADDSLEVNGLLRAAELYTSLTLKKDKESPP